MRNPIPRLGQPLSSDHAADCGFCGEQWKAIPGYEGYYEVSDLGRVRSLDRTIMRTNKFGTVHEKRISGAIKRLTREEPTPGYFRLSAGLSKDGKCRTRLVHQLVLEAFSGPCPDGHEVAHNDGDSENNRLGNLRYATPAANTHDKFRHGTMLQGEKVGTAKLTDGDVRFIRNMRGKLAGAVLADQFGIKQAQVTRIQKRQRWGHVQ